MKFVHLAPRDVVGMIKRRGLRMGNGIMGRGVYAVPLFRLPRFSVKESEDDDDMFDDWSECDFSTPTSTQDLWRFLFSPDRDRGLRPIAVMFEPPAEAWPADVRLDLWAPVMEVFVRGLKRRPIEGVQVTREDFDYMERALSERAGAYFIGPVHSAAALGALLRLYLKAGGHEHASGGDDVQVVFRRPIPPKYIQRLLALSQTNHEARRRRERMPADAFDRDDGN